MIKTIQYLAEADSSRVLVALDLKSGLPKCVSESHVVHLAAVFSKWCTGTTEHRVHCDSAYTRISANSGLGQGCPLSTCGFSAAIDPKLRSVPAEIADSMIQVAHFLLTLMTGICGSNLSACCQQLFSSQQKPDQATSQSQTHTQLSGEGHLQIHGDTEPSPLVLGEQASMEKTAQRFQKIATTLADLDAEGLNAQSVNDLLTMYVGAASQHVLRMSFVPEQEAHNFDRQVTTIWSHPIQRDVTSIMLFTSNLEDLVWALQSSDMQQPHGAFGIRSFPH